MTDNKELVAITSKITSAYVTNNPVDIYSLPNVISSIHTALTTASGSRDDNQKPNISPAVPASKSITDDHIICLDCGRKMKTLKRHLNAYHGLSPAEYRQRWGLSADYPIVAENYSKERTKLALESKFGKSNG